MQLPRKECGFKSLWDIFEPILNSVYFVFYRMFQIPVGYIWTKTSIYSQADSYMFQIPVGYIWTMCLLLRCLCLLRFQIPVGYIWTPFYLIVRYGRTQFQIPVGYIWTMCKRRREIGRDRFQIPVGYIWTYLTVPFHRLCLVSNPCGIYLNSGAVALSSHLILRFKSLWDIFERIPFWKKE